MVTAFLRRAAPALCLVAVLGVLGLLGGPSAASDPPTPGAPAPAAGEAAPTPPRDLTGRFGTEDGQRVLTLWGSPRERGFAHGWLMAKAIVAGVQRDFRLVMTPRFKTMYATLLRRVVVPKFAFDDRETAELEGLMAGIEARLSEAERTVPALERPIDLLDLKALNTFGDWYGLGCSSLAAWGELTEGGRTLVGRNFDFPAFDLVLKHQYVCVRAADGDRPGIVGVSYPGCIGVLTGMNAPGVFVAIHDVHVKPDMARALRPNVPRLLSVRRLLEKTHGAEACLHARDLVRDWPTLYGNNLMIVAPARADGVPVAAVLEYDGRADIERGCTMRVADRAAALAEDAPPVVCLACTNHHRCREEAPQPARLRLRPRWRYPKLVALGGEERPAKPLDVPALFARMAEAAYPRGGRPQEAAVSLFGDEAHHGTLHQCVGETESGRLHVRLGVVGKHIRDVPSRAYDVPDRVERAAPAQPAAR